MDKTRVFVSSSCFDLHQIRRDLETFITSMGYEPVLSDSETVSIPPGLDNIEACKWLVRASDVFVLIIGGRYGTTDEDTGKSITNIEYEAAFETGMPIYTFVDREVWLKQDTYKRLREMIRGGNLSEEKLQEALGDKIGDPRVFEFIDQIANAMRDTWIRDFSKAQEIIETLKNNWSLLFREFLFKRRSISAASVAQGLLPSLNVSWANPDGSPMESLDVFSFPELDKEEILRHLNALRPSDKELAVVESQKKLLASTPGRGFSSGLGGVPAGGSQGAEAVLNFTRHIDKLIEVANSDFQEFRWRYSLQDRAVELSLQILNDGTSPATNIVVYIEPTDKMFFCNLKDLSELTIQVPEERPQKVTKAIALAKNPPVAKLMSSLRYPSPVPASGLASGLTSGLIGTHISFPKRVSVGLEEGRLRIDIDGNLKHNFSQHVKGDNIYLCARLEKGEREEIEYKCHADNLPVPLRGFLQLRGV